MAGKITTLYVNDDSIRVMVTSGKRIVKLAEVPLNLEAGDAGPEGKKAELAAKIRHVFKANNLGTSKVILGLSGLHCLSRPATLPNLPWAMVDEAMLREAERVLPVSVDQLYVAWQVLSSDEESMQAFMVAVPRQVADPLLSLMNELGIKPYLVDIKPMALSRLVPEPNAILVDVQEKDFDVVILYGGVPQPIRSVPLPHEEIPLADKLAIVKDEIRRTVQFYNDNNPEHPVDPNIALYVSGEIAEEPELFESLETELGYRVAPLMSPLKCAKHLDPSNYLVNVGLALKEVGREAGPLLPNINILPEPYRPKPISVSKMMALPAVGIAAAIIAMLAMTVQDAAANISTMQNELDSANRVINQRQTQQKELSDSIASLESDIASLKTQRDRYEAAYESLGNESDRLDGHLDAVVDRITASLDVSSINLVSDAGPSIAGVATNEDEVLRYARSLDATGLFSEVIINKVSRDAEGEEVSDDDTFSFDITLIIGEAEE